MIQEVKSAGGYVEQYRAFGTSLPSSASNTNPLGYKFSWSPEGFFLGAVTGGRYLKDGHVREVSAEDLFSHYQFVEIPGVGVFEAFVNRDAISYMDLYGINSASSMYRGSLRYPGSCETWHLFKKLGLFDGETLWDFSLISPRNLMARLIGYTHGDLEECLCKYLGVPMFSVFLHKLKWLGLLNEKPLPELGRISALDFFSRLLQKRLAYKSGETDLLVLHHEITARFSDDSSEIRTATLALEGTPGGDSATSRAVGLPAAVAVRLILEGKITARGVQIPIIPEIYNQVLLELENLEICMTKKNNL
jgi:saccharopine dehydrogenase-like NADP-dependent oxidoreductase